MIDTLRSACPGHLDLFDKFQDHERRLVVLEHRTDHWPFEVERKVQLAAVLSTECRGGGGAVPFRVPLCTGEHLPPPLSHGC